MVRWGVALHRQLVDHHRLSCGKAAINHKTGAIDEAGFVRPEIGDGGGDIVGAPDPPHGIPARQLFENLRIAFLALYPTARLVRMVPGLTMFARTPCGPYSTAMACVRLSSPAFAAL